MIHWLIIGSVISTLPDGQCRTEHIECRVRALDYLGACDVVREKFTSVVAAVWIDHDRSRKIAA